MKPNSYRVEYTDYKEKLKGIIYFSTLEEAEKFLKNHKFLEEHCHNLIPSNKRFGAIWESAFKIN